MRRRQLMIAQVSLVVVAIAPATCLGPGSRRFPGSCEEARLIILYANGFVTDPHTCAELEEYLASTTPRESNAKSVHPERLAPPGKGNTETDLAMCLYHLDLLEGAGHVLSGSKPDVVLVLVEAGADDSGAQWLVRRLKKAGVCALVGRNPRGESRERLGLGGPAGAVTG